MFRFYDGDKEVVINQKPKFYFIASLTMITLPYCLYKAYKDKKLIYVLNLLIVLWTMSYFVYLIRDVDIPPIWISLIWIILFVYIIAKFIFGLPTLELQYALNKFEYIEEEKYCLTKDEINFVEQYKKPFFILKIKEIKR